MRHGNKTRNHTHIPKQRNTRRHKHNQQRQNHIAKQQHIPITHETTKKGCKLNNATRDTVQTHTNQHTPKHIQQTLRKDTTNKQTHTNSTCKKKQKQTNTHRAIHRNNNTNSQNKQASGKQIHHLTTHRSNNTIHKGKHNKMHKRAQHETCPDSKLRKSVETRRNTNRNKTNQHRENNTKPTKQKQTANTNTSKTSNNTSQHHRTHVHILNTTHTKQDATWTTPKPNKPNTQ